MISGFAPWARPNRNRIALDVILYHSGVSPEMTCDEVFTAAQIASALQRSKRSVLATLVDTAAGRNATRERKCGKECGGSRSCRSACELRWRTLPRGNNSTLRCCWLLHHRGGSRNTRSTNVQKTPWHGRRCCSGPSLQLSRECMKDPI